MKPWCIDYDVQKNASGLLVANDPSAAAKINIPSEIFGHKVLVDPAMPNMDETVKFGPSLVSKMYPAWCLSRELPEWLDERDRLAVSVCKLHDEFETSLGKTALGRWSEEAE